MVALLWTFNDSRAAANFAVLIDYITWHLGACAREGECCTVAAEGQREVNVQISYMDMPHGPEPAAASVSRQEDRSASQPDQARAPSWPPPGVNPDAAASAAADVNGAWTAGGAGSSDELAWPTSSSSWGQVHILKSFSMSASGSRRFGAGIRCRGYLCMLRDEMALLIQRWPLSLCFVSVLSCPAMIGKQERACCIFR